MPPRQPLILPAGGRLFQLDGWRAISIFLVLAAHLLPLGPKALELNETAARAGMSLFFTLSGYLITSFLLRRPEIKPFLIRRLCRILPLAWTAAVALLLIYGGSPGEWLSNLGFLINYQHEYIRPYNSHFWSLGVEIHFYLAVAMLVAIGGSRSLIILPLLALAVTTLRAVDGVTVSIVTHLRVDEILAGATLALLLAGKLPAGLASPLRVPPWLWLVLLALTCSPLLGPMNYFRPYVAAAVVGSTLLQPDHPLVKPLGTKILAYFAAVSYALYVIHGPLRYGWFADEDTVTRYLIKRPATIALTLVLAHLSTFYWEAWWIKLGKRLTSRKADPEAFPPLADQGHTSTN